MTKGEGCARVSVYAPGVNNFGGGAHNAQIHTSGQWVGMINPRTHGSVDVVDLRGTQAVHKELEAYHALVTPGSYIVESDRPVGAGGQATDTKGALYAAFLGSVEFYTSNFVDRFPHSIKKKISCVSDLAKTGLASMRLYYLSPYKRNELYFQ